MSEHQKGVRLPIRMDREYEDLRGEPVRILCIDRPCDEDDLPVVVMRKNGTIFYLNKYGEDGLWNLIIRPRPDKVTKEHLIGIWENGIRAIAEMDIDSGEAHMIIDEKNPPITILKIVLRETDGEWGVESVSEYSQ